MLYNMKSDKNITPEQNPILNSIWFLFNCQQSHIIFDRFLCKRKHYPFAVMINFCFIVNAKNLFTEFASQFLNLFTFRSSENNHKANSLFICVKPAERLSPFVVFTLVLPPFPPLFQATFMCRKERRLQTGDRTERYNQRKRCPSCFKITGQ